ncbi:WD40-repeat-containing domain protein [Mycena rosella]|uniref:WD40-repeat-containing domain protein n=1 Tax=Mycena rosella TaxID=1033263 RepID=A0AAD7GJH2_MYCRO|nr:WD40-repeat-containing domain protein [Mycena rosella]
MPPQHRTLQPTGPAHGHTRLVDALDTVKQEYDLLTTELVQARTLRDEYEAKVTSQINELNIIRQSLYELEAQHGKVRHQYEEEIAHLRAELHTLRQQPLQLPGPGIHPGEPAPGYFRERERGGDRDRERDRERERERERERDRGGERDPKRLKLKSGEHFSPLLKGPPPGAAVLPPVQNGGGLSGGPSGNGAGNGLPLPGVGAVDARMADARMVDARGGAMESPHARMVDSPHSHSHGPEERDFPDPADVPADLKKEGSDWFAVFNPRARPRVLTDVGLVHTLIHATVVCCVQFSADGKYLATGCNRTAQIYDVKTGVKTCVLADDSAGKAGDLYIRSVRFSPDGRYLATGAEDKQIRIWDIAKKRILRIFEGHTQEIYALDFSRDGRRLVSGSGDRTARVWDVDSGGCTILSVDDPVLPGAGAAAGGAAGGDAGVTSVAMSPDGRYVAAGSLDTLVRIWDAATGMLVERLRGHRDSVYSVVFTQDGRGIVSGSLDKTLKYWDVAGLGRRKEAGAVVKAEAGEKIGQCTMNFTGHKDYVLSVAVSHDGRWVVSGSKDRGVQFWDRAGVVQCMLQGHKNSVISIDLNPTGPLLATGSGDNLARIWSYTTA